MHLINLPKIGPALFLGLALALGQAFADTPPIHNPTPVLSGLKVSRTIVNLARDFELTLTHPSWDCNTEFTRSASGVVDRTIMVGISITQKQGTPCTADEKGGDITVFVTGAIPTGNYTVEVTGFASCTPSCSGAPLWTATAGPIALDLEKILKAQTSSIFTHPEEVGMAVASYRNGGIDLVLPGNRAGAWQAEVFAPSGKRISSASMKVAGEATHSSLALAIAPESGVYFLRLHSAERQIQTLRIAVQD